MHILSSILLTEVQKLLHGKRRRRKFGEMLDVFRRVGQRGVFHDKTNELHVFGCSGVSAPPFCVFLRQQHPTLNYAKLTRPASFASQRTIHNNRGLAQKSTAPQPIGREEFYLLRRLTNESREGAELVQLCFPPARHFSQWLKRVFIYVMYWPIRASIGRGLQKGYASRSNG